MLWYSSTTTYYNITLINNCARHAQSQTTDITEYSSTPRFFARFAAPVSNHQHGLFSSGLCECAWQCNGHTATGCTRTTVWRKMSETVESYAYRYGRRRRRLSVADLHPHRNHARSKLLAYTLPQDVSVYSMFPPRIFGLEKKRRHHWWRRFHLACCRLLWISGRLRTRRISRSSGRSRDALRGATFAPWRAVPPAPPRAPCRSGGCR